MERSQSSTKKKEVKYVMNEQRKAAWDNFKVNKQLNQGNKTKNIESKAFSERKNEA